MGLEDCIAGGNVTSVAVFFAPKQQQWVIRQFQDWFCVGDCLVEKEPTDEELIQKFGDIEIKRGYSVSPFLDTIKKELEDKDQ